MISAIIRYFSKNIYPPELTQGFDSPIIAGDSKKPAEPGQFWTSYEPLRNMEMLVVARVISRPEPPVMERTEGTFYVSKAWCRAALRWLEVQADERRDREIKRLQRAEELARAVDMKPNKKNQHIQPNSASKLLKRSKKEQRMRSRKLSDVVAPWPDVNADIICPHYHLHHEASKSKRRLMDKQAWKVLKKLYPDSVQLSGMDSECIQCKLETETARKNEEMKKQKETAERKKPLECPLVRAVYSRSGGVPRHKLVHYTYQDQERTDEELSQLKPPPRLRFANGCVCPLVPGIYHALPREWCYRWRRYIKTGEGGRPAAPDSSSCLCDAHMLPLIPPHLEHFLFGEVSALLGRNAFSACDEVAVNESRNAIATLSSPNVYYPVGYYPIYHQQQHQNQGLRDNSNLNHSIAILRASGLSDVEIEAQRLAMFELENQQQTTRLQQAETQAQERHRSANISNVSPESIRGAINEELDRKNYIVVEILTDEEFVAFERWWPGIHSSYALEFAVVKIDQDCVEILWTTAPCRECDATGLHHKAHALIRSTIKGWNNPCKR